MTIETYITPVEKEKAIDVDESFKSDDGFWNHNGDVQTTTIWVLVTTPRVETTMIEWLIAASWE